MFQITLGSNSSIHSTAEEMYNVVTVLNRPDYNAIRKHVINEIENIILDLCSQLVAGKVPTIIYDTASNVNDEDIIYDNTEDNKDKECSITNLCKTKDKRVHKTSTKVVCFGHKDGRKKLALILQVMQRIHQFLVNGNKQFQTRRSLFYELKEKVNTSVLVQNQQCVDRIVKNIAEILSCLEWDMNIVATAKGLAAGKLIYYVDDEIYLDFNVKKDGVLLSHNISNVTSIKHNVEMMIIVEKDSVFQKLLSEGCPSLMNCILVTGKGYPDFATRRFVKIVSEELNIPVYIIVDADPFGIDIFCAYRYGTIAQSRLRDQLICPNIRWLGIHPSEIDGLKLTSVRRSALSSADNLKLKSLEKKSYLSQSIRFELEQLKRGKLEIEAIADYSDGFLSTVYLPMKIIKNWFIR